MQSKKAKLIAEVSAQVAQNYREQEIAMYGDSLRLPNRQAIIEIIRDFQKILFPAYFGEKYLLKLPPEEYSALLLDHVYDKLALQIELAMEDSPASHDEARAICDRLLERLPAIQSTLMKDLTANFQGDPAASSRQEVIFSYPGLFAIFIYRIAHELYLERVPMIPRIMTEYAHSQTGIDINPGATIGEYFFIDHGTGIVIGETSEIGDHVNLYQGVTLGALSPVGTDGAPTQRRHPKVGNDVTIYSGATILGGETEISDHTVIGGNTFLTKSVKGYRNVSFKKPELKLRGGEE